jgi:hypothetical protein
MRSIYLLKKQLITRLWVSIKLALKIKILIMILISNLTKANKEILKALFKKKNKSQKLIPLEDNKNTKAS